jgi:hypothetical protein
MKKIILSLLLSLPFYANAQELITTTGGAGNGTIWSVGEVATTTLTTTDKTYFLTQGFLQPEYLSTTAIASPRNNDAQLSAYLNPVTDQLYIRSGDASGNAWKIYDSVGRILDTGRFSGSESVIDFNNYASGYYILIVLSGERIQSIKIIK